MVGNAICVNVLTEIVRNLLPEEEDDDTANYYEGNDEKPTTRLRRLNQHLDETTVPSGDGDYIEAKKHAL